MLNNKPNFTEIFTSYQFHYFFDNNRVSAFVAVSEGGKSFMIAEEVNYNDCYVDYDYTLKDIEEYASKYNFKEQDTLKRLLKDIALWYQLVDWYEKQNNKYELIGG